MKRSKSILCLSVVAIVMAVMCPANAVMDNFDAYPGGGTDWGGPLGTDWIQSGNSTVQTVAWSDASPITSGSGGYLTYRTNTTGTTGIARDFEGAVGSSAYTATFTVRIDDLGTFWAGNSLTGDRFQLRAETSNGLTSGITSQSASGAWLFTASPGLATDNWYVYDGDIAGYVGGYARQNFFDSGIALVEGGIYNFTFTITDLLANTYEATLTDGTTSFTYTGARYRTAGTSPADRIVFSNNIRSGSEPIQMSIDSINIVPEPATLVLLACGTLASLRRRG